MIKNSILRLSWYILETLHNFNLNYLYVDTLAKEQVLQQKIEPNSYNTISHDYSTWYLPYPYTVENLKNIKKIHRFVLIILQLFAMMIYVKLLE